jgi:hypothetical protein
MFRAIFWPIFSQIHPVTQFETAVEYVNTFRLEIFPRRKRWRTLCEFFFPDENGGIEVTMQHSGKRHCSFSAALSFAFVDDKVLFLAKRRFLGRRERIQ